MSRPFTLENFNDPQMTGLAAAKVTVDEAELEALRLHSYESGYQAGWDDAIQRSANDKAHIEAEFARNLEDLGFTFHEARSHVLSSLEPLLKTISEKFLPEVVQVTLAQVINEEILPIAAEAADTPIEVRISPGSRDTLESLVGANRAIPIQIVEDDTLADGQIFLKSASAERCIDMNAALDHIKGAVAALYNINEKAFNYD